MIICFTLKKNVFLTNISLLVVPTIAPIPINKNSNNTYELNERNSLRAIIEQIPIPVFLIRVGNNSFA
jgi:hypothetical protein